MPVLIVDGKQCAPFRPPVVRAGRTFAALSGCLAKSVDRVRVDPEGVVSITRGPRRVLMQSGERRELVDGEARSLPVSPFWYLGAMYVPVFESFTPLGALVSDDAQSVSVRFAPPGALATPAPVPIWYPRVAPTVVFTPIPSPMPVWTQNPHPRRTPIHVISMPHGAK